MGCDTICDLPDSLLTQILLNLPTKDSTRTSVLSTRWRNLWLSVPALDLATFEFPNEEVFARFVNRFMEINHRSHLQRFNIIYEEINGYRDQFMELIGTVVDCGIQHLDMYPCKGDAFMPMNIYKSKTLVSLKLAKVKLENPEFVVSLPCLKIMHLEYVWYDDNGPSVVEKLISGCHVLEDFELIRVHRPFDIFSKQVLLGLPVRSQTLKRCCLRLTFNWDYKDFTVEIDAPPLEYLSLSERQIDRIVVNNLSSLLMIDIHTECNYLQPANSRKRDIFCDFLTGISSVRHMIICQWTLKMLYCYSELGPIPKFYNLHHLQAEFFNSSLQILPALLESCPNLKNLIFDFPASVKREKIDFHKVPRCLMSTLEYVKITKLIMKEKNGIKLVNYFLENSAVLKKLSLSVIHYTMTKQGPESYKKLLTSTKLSPTCQVIID